MIEIGGEARDARHRGAIDLAGAGVRVVVREIGRDDEQRLGSAPEALDHLRDLGYRGVAYRERREHELAELPLQEWQLHFERVLLQMREIAGDDLRQLARRGQGGLVERDVAERRRERLDRGNGEAAHRHAMHRPEQHDPAHDAARRAEPVVGMRGHRPGVDVARMRHDERLGKAQARRRRVDAAEELVELGIEAARVRWIEGAGDGRGTDGSHAFI